MSCPQFGTPVSSNTAPQMGSFNFGAGAAADKPAFGEVFIEIRFFKILFIYKRAMHINQHEHII